MRVLRHRKHICQQDFLCVCVCVCNCVCASGLLLQYHAPLADELLCSSLVPLSPNQARHNMSQCGHKWGKTPLAIRSISYLTPSVKLRPVRCARRPKNSRENGRRRRDAHCGCRRGDRRRLDRSWGIEQTVRGLESRNVFSFPPSFSVALRAEHAQC